MLEVRATCPPAELEQVVNDDLRRFETWFKTLGNDPLVRSEVAILKTYLFWRIRGEGHAPTGS